MRNLPSSLSLSRSLTRSARPPSGYHLNSAHAPRTNLDQDHSSVYLSISAPSGAAYLGSEFLHFQFTVGMLFNVKLADQTKNKSTSLSEAITGYMINIDRSGLSSLDYMCTLAGAPV